MAQTTVLISADPGKHTTKALTKYGVAQRKVDFRTKLFKVDSSFDYDVQAESYKIEMEGQRYIIGEQGEEISYDIDKANINHKLAVYTAISQLIYGSPDVNLVVGCPVSIYKNKELRSSYKDFILGNSVIELLVNGREYSFCINNVLVLPEGSGIVYIRPDLFKDTRTAVIDLGGLNMNFTVYNNFTPELGSMFTVNHGSSELENLIINQLSSKFGLTLNHADAQFIIRQGGLKIKGKIDPSSGSMVNSIIDNYISRIQQEIRRNNYNLETLDVVFVGGTSLLVKDRLKHFFSYAVIADDAQWSNAEGFYRMGAMKYAKSE